MTDCYLISDGLIGGLGISASLIDTNVGQVSDACCTALKSGAQDLIEVHWEAVGKNGNTVFGQLGNGPDWATQHATATTCLDDTCYTAAMTALSSKYAKGYGSIPTGVVTNYNVAQEWDLTGLDDPQTAFKEKCAEKNPNHEFPAGGFGDPHMQGFNGQRFDVVGRANATYNLLADDRLQLSMDTNPGFFDHAAQDTALDGSPPLFMTGVNVAAIDASGAVFEVVISGDLESSLHGSSCDSPSVACPLLGLRVQVIGGRVSDVHDEANVQLSEGFTLMTENTKCGLDNPGCSNPKGKKKGRATFSTPFLELQVGAILMNNHNLEARVLHHIDFSINRYSPSGQVGGILGSTLEVRYNQAGVPILEGPESIEGDEDDFLIDALTPFQLRNTIDGKGGAGLLRASGDGEAAL